MTIAIGIFFLLAALFALFMNRLNSFDRPAPVAALVLFVIGAAILL